MKFSFILFSLFLLPNYASATIECENKLIAHFIKLEHKPHKMMDEQDELHPLKEKLVECVTNNDEMDLEAIIKLAEKYRVKNSYANSAIRVCTAISLMVSQGNKNIEDIELKTLDFQNGWSNGMREPLSKIIEEEIKNSATKVDCAPFSKKAGVNINGRENIPEKDFSKAKVKVKEAKASAGSKH